MVDGVQISVAQNHSVSAAQSDGQRAMTIAADDASLTCQPAMDSDSAMKMTLRRRPVTGDHERSHSMSQQTPSSSPSRADNMAQHHPQRDNSAGTVATMCKMLVGWLGMTAAYRGLKHPMDFLQHPKDAILGSITLSTRADEHTLAQANHTVLSHFGKYIPQSSSCYRTRTEISFDLPVGIAGQHIREGAGHEGLIKLKAYNAPGNDPGHTARHEFVHCYSHPDFVDTLKKTPYQTAINEGITEHLSDKMPQLPWPLDTDESLYHVDKIHNGKTFTEAASELEQKIGEDTLFKAFFSGDKKAIAELAAAATSVYPKDFSSQTWSNIAIVTRLKGVQQLAECYIGSLAANNIAVPGAIYSGGYLPVSFLSGLTAEQINSMQHQADECRQRIGADIFDAAFYSFDTDSQRDYLKAMREEVKMHWRPVLTG